MVISDKSSLSYID